MPVFIPVARLVALCDPFSNPWGSRPFTVKHVERAIQEGQLLDLPYPEDRSWSREQHIQRIAWLSTYGWEKAVEVDVGVPSQGCVPFWPLLDGNHRLAAAVVRGDTYVLSSVSGDIDYAHSLFGVDVSEAASDVCPSSVAQLARNVFQPQARLQHQT